jgi:hypothetical protein
MYNVPKHTSQIINLHGEFWYYIRPFLVEENKYFIAKSVIVTTGRKYNFSLLQISQ